MSRRYLGWLALAGTALLVGPGSDAGFGATSATYRSTVLGDSPASYWRLGETFGTTAADQLNRNPGTYTNGVTLNQPGALAPFDSDLDPSASFNGTNQYVVVPDSPSLDLTKGVTIEFWAKRRAVSGTWQVLVGKPGNGQSKYENYAVWLDPSNYYQAYFGNGTAYVTVYTSAATDTNWHYVVATYDGSTAKIYQDGVLKASTSSTLQMAANPNPLNLGRANNNGSFFNGWLDEVAIYPNALSATQVQNHYKIATTDLLAPNISLSAPTNGSATANSSVTFSGTAGSAPGDSSSVTVSIYSGSSATGVPTQTLSTTSQSNNAYSVSTTLPDGKWTAQATQNDAAGNVGVSSANTFTVATSAPNITISGPSTPTNQTNATLTFVADQPATFQCSLDGAMFASCASPKTYPGLGNGNHAFQVLATGVAGVTSTSTYSWTINTIPPPAPAITSSPPTETTATTASFGFSDSQAGVNFLCQLDGGQYLACGSPQAYAALAIGVHTFGVEATDTAGNVSPATTYTWTVNSASVPTPTLDATPTNPSSSSIATFSFSDSMSGVSFQCSVDGGAYAACTSSMSVTLPDGQHTFQAEAVDAVGDVSSAASYTWTIDTTAPTDTIISEPANPSNSPTASFAFSANETATFQCSLDGALAVACMSSQAYSGLPDGSHTFQLTATDGAGNTSTSTYTWTIDTALPVTTITSSPSPLSNSASASFSFTSNEPANDTAVFQCSLDGGAFTSCVSPQTYSGLPDGGHNFRVRATDLAGNVGQAVGISWTIDTTAPPPPTINASPPSLTNSATASVSFASTQAGVSFLCQLDGGAFSTCTSPQAYTGLADGSHTFQVETSDAAGNISMPASSTWTVDTTPPVTTFTATPGNPSTLPANFYFVANETATFQCSLDGAPFAACTSPTSYSSLSDGSHTLQVATTDMAGNVGATISYTWTVDTTPPNITLLSPGNGNTRAEWPTFTGGAGTAAGDQTTVTVNVYSGSQATGQPLQTMTGTYGLGGTYAITASAPLNPGTYTAQAQQIDAATNVGSSSANTFTVGDPQILAAGDIAYCLTDGAARTAPLLSTAPDALVMPLGDNAYVNGQPSEYSGCYAPTWGTALARTRPVVGAHDEGTVSGGPPPGTGYVNYFAHQLAPLGASASDPTKLYYSYNLGAWHIVVLNDGCIDGTTPNCNEAAQEQWLQSDLSANSRSCTLAVWHRPRWSSDSIHGPGWAIVGTFWNILYQNGVDLVLNGSAHDYERFAPQDPLGNADPQYGIREIVAGTGGDFTYNVGTLLPNSQVYDSSSYGALKVTLHSSSYDWQFVPVADGQSPDGGSFTDSGTSSCHGVPPPPPPSAPAVRSSSSNTVNSGTSLAVSAPAGRTQGDLLVAVMSHQGGSARSVSPPSGWTAVPNTDYWQGTNARIHAYYHFVGASEPASYSFALTGGSAVAMAGGIIDIAGANASTPINASSGQPNGSTASKYVNAPSITTSVANTLLIYAGAVNVATTWQAPGLMTTLFQGATNTSYNVSDEVAAQPLSSAGASGTRSGLLASSGTSVADMIAIQP